MKKINFLWLVSILMLLPIGFVSCSDDDDEGVGSASDLVGTWEVTHNVWYEKENGVKKDGDTDDDKGDLRIIFKEDGTYISGEKDEDGNWDWDEPCSWSYKDGKLTSTDKYGESETITLKELTSSKLVWEEYEEEYVGGRTLEYYNMYEYRKISD